MNAPGIESRLSARVISSKVGVTRYVCPDGLVTEEEGAFHAAQIILKCIGFRVNEGNERLLGRAHMGADSVVERDVQISVEPHLDEAANGLPLIGHVNGIRFGAKMMARAFVRNEVHLTTHQIHVGLQPRVRINHFTASQALTAMLRMADSDRSFHALLMEVLASNTCPRTVHGASQHVP